MSDANDTQQPGTAEPAQPEQQPEPAKGEETDWKAMARKWEKLAKENSKATEELDKLRKQSMSDQERAVADAKAAGLAEAAKTYGSKLAAAKLEAAAASKGVDLSSIGKYLNASQFVGEDGEVDDAAIKAAVADFAKSMAGPKRSGGDFNGSNGAGQITRDQLASMSASEIAKAHADGKLNHLM